MPTFSDEEFNLLNESDGSLNGLEQEAENFEKAKIRRVEESQKRTNGLEPNDAFEALKAVKFATEEQALAGEDADPNKLSRQFTGMAARGEIESVVNKMEEVEGQRLKQEQQNVIRADLESRVRSGEPVTQEEVDQIRSGVLGFSPADPFFHDAKAAAENQKQRKILERGRKELEAIAAGYSKETVARVRAAGREATLEEVAGEAIEPGQALGATEPIFSPVDILTDVATGALLAKGIKVAGKELFKLGEEGLVKSIGREAAYGSLAGGFMSVASLTGAGPTMQLVSGLVGPSATAAMATMSRRSLSTFMQRMRDNNPKIYREFGKVVKGKKDDFAKALQDTIDGIERGEIILPREGDSTFPQSPLATTAQNAQAAGDEGATRAVSEAIVTAAGEADNEVGRLAQRASGTGSATGMATLPIDDQLGPVVAGVTGKSLDNRSDLSEFIHNANKISDGTVRHMLHDILAESNSNVPDIINAAIYKNRGIYVGGLAEAASNSFKTGKIGTGSKVFHPTRFLGDLSMSAVDIPTINERDARRITKAAEGIVKGVFKGLKDEESAELQNLFRVATDLNEPMVPVRGGLAPASNLDKIYPATDKLIRKFAEGRMVMDSLWEAGNQATLQTWRNKGLRQLDNQFIVEPKKNVPNGTTDVDGKVWNKEMQEGGFTPVRLINTQDKGSKRKAYKFLGPGEVDNRLTEISDDIQAIPFRESYMPIRIAEETGKFHVVKAQQDPKSGEWKVNRVAAGATQKEVNETISELNRLDGSAKYFAVRRDESANINDLAMDKGLSDIFRTMSRKDIEAFKNALKADPNISKQEAQDILGYIESYNYQKIQPLRRRGSERLRRAEEVTKNLRKDAEVEITDKIRKELAGEEPFLPTDRSKIIDKSILEAPEAPLEPTEAAMANYIQLMSRYISHSDWNAKLQDDFVDRFGGVLDHQRWSANISADGKLIDNTGNRRPWNDEERKLVKEAMIAQEQLRRAFNLPSQAKRDAQIWWRNAADYLENKPAGKVMSKAIDRFLSDGIRIGGAAASRTLGATTKLGLFAWSQLVVQPTVALNAFRYAGTNPQALVQGMRDFHGAYTRAMIGGKLGLPVSKKDQNLLDIIEHSGVNTGIDFDYAQRVMTSVGGWGKQGSRIAKVGGGVVKAGFHPLNVGESSGRGIIFFSERRALIDRIKAGEHPRFTEKDIDSDAFIAEVKLSTDQVAGNFTKFNKAWIAQEGWRSAILQFTSYPLFQAEFMFGKGLGKRERAAVWSAWVAMFGAEGIPFINDIEFVGEQAAAWATDDPTMVGATDRWKLQATKKVAEQLLGPDVPDDVRQFLQRFTTGGSIAALSEGELNWARRAGLGEFTRRFIDGLSFADLAGVGVSTAWKFMDDSISSTKDLLDMLQNEEVNKEGILRELQEGTKELSGFTNMIGSARPSLYDSRNRIQVKDPTTGHRIQKFIGLTPGRAVSLSEREWAARREARAWKDWMFEQAGDIVAMSRENPETAKATFNERAEFLMNKNPRLLRQFMDIFFAILPNRDLPEDLRTQWLEHKKGVTPLNDFFTE